MNYFWDIVLKAQEQGKKAEELFFRQAKEYSPYIEQSFPYINETKVEEDTIELNLMCRFANIFQNLLSAELEETLREEGQALKEFREYLIDAALHTILYSDLRCGMTKRDIYTKKLAEELLAGTFWRAAAPAFAQIDSDRRGRLLNLVLTQMQTGSSLHIFRRAMLVLYPDASLYQLKAERDKLILYLREKDSYRNQQSLQFVQDIFLPVRYQLRVFWEYHFGVIGVDATMKIDEIALY